MLQQRLLGRMGQCSHTGTATQTNPKPRLSPDPAAKGGPDALGHLRRIFALDFGTELLLSRRMIYSACGLAYSLFKISCWLGKCGKDICIPGMDVDFSQCLSESRQGAGSGQLLQPFSPWSTALELEHWAVRWVHSMAVI